MTVRGATITIHPEDGEAVSYRLHNDVSGLPEFVALRLDGDGSATVIVGEVPYLLRLCETTLQAALALAETLGESEQEALLRISAQAFLLAAHGTQR